MKQPEDFRIEHLERRVQAMKEVMLLQDSLIKSVWRRLAVMCLSGAVVGASAMRLYLLGIGV